MKKLVLSLLVGVALVGCGIDLDGPDEPGPTGGSDGGDGGGTSRGPIAESDPDVVAGFAPWIQSCIGWIRTDCKKARSCDINPSSDCWDDDYEVRDTCVAMVRDEDCSAATPGSFDRCADRTDEKSCQEYCDSQFCFNFCFFSCTD